MQGWARRAARGRTMEEGQRVAAASAAAAAAVTLGKLVAGLASGSVAIVADAAHSAVDLVATVVTYLAIRAAARPPDPEHPYGHGKAEHLAASFEALLLLLTAAGAVGEALRRLLVQGPELHLSPWVLLVPAASMAVDGWRFRALSRSARRLRSQALAADALNFQADMWSSGAALAGLLVARFGGWPAADAVAGLAVAGVVARAGIRLGRQALDALLDAAPPRLAEEIRAAARQVGGVLDAGPVRLREAGGKVFADLVVTVPRTETLARAHDVADAVEASVQRLHDAVDVVVHVEPSPAADESPADAVRAAARRLGLSTHDERVHQVGGRLHVSLHLELAPSLSLARADAVARALERAIRETVPGVEVVEIHLEPQPQAASARVEVTAGEPEVVANLRSLADAGGVACGTVQLYRVGGGQHRWDAYLTCRFPPGLALDVVHERTELLERAIRNKYPEMRQVVIAAEPDGSAGDPPPPSSAGDPPPPKD